jgi:glutathione peroxidase-family protein
VERGVESFRSIVEDSSSVNLLLIKIFDIPGRKWNFQKFSFSSITKQRAPRTTWRDEETDRKEGEEEKKSLPCYCKAVTNYDSKIDDDDIQWNFKDS